MPGQKGHYIMMTVIFYLYSFYGSQGLKLIKENNDDIDLKFI